MTNNEQFLAAAKTANVEQMKKYLDAGANINARDTEGNNALHILAQIELNTYQNEYLRNKGIIENAALFLIKTGINYELENNSGYSVIRMSSNSAKVIKPLIQQAQ